MTIDFAGVTEAQLIRIPLRFYDDHESRDLPTPELVKRTSTYGVVRSDDPALPELLDVARYYYSSGVEGPAGAVPGLANAARALIEALGRGGVK